MQLQTIESEKNLFKYILLLFLMWLKTIEY
jgi:hypothetical protein